MEPTDRYSIKGCGATETVDEPENKLDAGVDWRRGVTVDDCLNAEGSQDNGSYGREQNEGALYEAFRRQCWELRAS